MNIRKVFIAHSWSDVGINIQTKAVAKKLSETTEVLYLSQARIGKPELRVNNKLRVAEWPSKRPNTIKDFFFICKKIIHQKPDVFIVHFGATNISMIAAWLLRVKYRICWLHTLTGQYYSDIKDDRIAKKVIKGRKRIYALATHIVVLNKYGFKDAINNYSLPQKKVFQIFNGIYSPKAVTVNNNAVRSFRFAGRLDNSKGADILIKAFARVYKENKDMVLEIAGKGSEEENIKATIREEKLEDVVKLHGFFDQYAKATKFISEAYCLIVPSKTDNFPTVILEAFSAAVPVIASNVGGIPDMLEDGKEGYLIESENVEALAGAMEKLVGNAELRNRMSKQAKKTFEEKFSMEKHVNNVLEFLNGLD